MGVNRVDFGDDTIIDISDSTVDENNLIQGATAYSADGEKIEGKVVVADVIDNLDSTSSTDALSAKQGHILDNSINNIWIAIDKRIEQLYILPNYPGLYTNNICQYIGEDTDEYKHGYFYKYASKNAKNYYLYEPQDAWYSNLLFALTDKIPTTESEFYSIRKDTQEVYKESGATIKSVQPVYAIPSGILAYDIEVEGTDSGTYRHYIADEPLIIGDGYEWQQWDVQPNEGATYTAGDGIDISEDKVISTETRIIDIKQADYDVLSEEEKMDASVYYNILDVRSVDGINVVKQYESIPSPVASDLGVVCQYIGTTTAQYTNGYFYKCIVEGDITHYDAYTKDNETIYLKSFLSDDIFELADPVNLIFVKSTKYTLCEYLFDFDFETMTSTHSGINVYVGQIIYGPDDSIVNQKVKFNRNKSMDKLKGKFSWEQINVQPQKSIDEIVDKIYPIGSIYMSVNNVNPSNLFGGGWEQIKDKFILSAGDTYEAGNTGGASSVTLATANLPSHNHSFTGSAGTTGNQSADHSHSTSATGTVSAWHTHSATTGNPSANHSHGQSGTFTSTNSGSHTHKMKYNKTGKSGTDSNRYNSSGTTWSDGSSMETTGGHTHSITLSGSTGTVSAWHTHSLTTGNPSANHTHSVTTGGVSANHNHSFTPSGTVGNTGSGSSFSILPPYLSVYVWKRIS